MKREPYEVWEEKFLSFCMEKLDEEPLYPFDHLWEKGLSVEHAFKKYVKENPDYEEKFLELFEARGNLEEKSEPTSILAGNLLEENKKKQALEKLEKFCPNCARILKKNVCKCGFRKKSTKSPEW